MRLGKKRSKKLKAIRLKNKKIIKKYPFLAPLDFYGYKATARCHKYIVTILDDIPKGWRKLMLQWAEDVKSVLAKGNYLREFTIGQAKEKYGRLEIFDNGCPNSIYKEVSRLSSDYEIISENVCIDCGSPYAKMCNIGWVSPFCEKCFKKYYYNIDYNSVTKESDVMDNFYKITRWGNGSRTEEIIDISDKVARIKSKWRV